MLWVCSSCRGFSCWIGFEFFQFLGCFLLLNLFFFGSEFVFASIVFWVCSMTQLLEILLGFRVYQLVHVFFGHFSFLFCFLDVLGS